MVSGRGRCRYKDRVCQPLCFLKNISEQVIARSPGANYAGGAGTSLYWLVLCRSTTRKAHGVFAVFNALVGPVFGAWRNQVHTGP
jgi:hypothetical protein